MIIAMLAIVFGANYYIFFRLWHMIPMFPASRAILVCVAVFVVIVPFVIFLLGDRFSYSVSALLYRVGVAWYIVMFYLAIIFFVLDMIRISGLLPLNQFMFGSWAGFGILFAFMAVLLTAGNINYHNKKRVELNINIDKETKPLKIVAISDLHLGYGIGTKEFRQWVELINRENPDVVLLAGDVIDSSIKPLYDRDFADVFREINTRYGVFMALGNHDYIANVAKSIEFLTNAGVTVLRDTAVLVNNAFYIAGRDDRTNRQRKAIAEITASLDKSKPIILIDHQPFQFDEVEAQNIDFYVAGHTHRGEVLPATWIAKTMFELSYGYLKKGNTHFYVTSGIAAIGKFRIGSRSEYVVVNIK